MSSNLEAQAIIFCRYLIGERPSQEIVDRYTAAIRNNFAPLNRGEKRLLRFIEILPFLVSAIDGGLAICCRESKLRQRILLLLAILETSPHYHAHFAEETFTLWRAVPMGFSIACSSVSSAFGILMVSVNKIL